jgi:hypothetical protein
MHIKVRYVFRTFFIEIQHRNTAVSPSLSLVKTIRGGYATAPALQVALNGGEAPSINSFIIFQYTYHCTQNQKKVNSSKTNSSKTNMQQICSKAIYPKSNQPKNVGV